MVLRADDSDEARARALDPGPAHPRAHTWAVTGRGHVGEIGTGAETVGVVGVVADDPYDIDPRRVLIDLKLRRPSQQRPARSGSQLRP